MNNSGLKPENYQDMAEELRSIADGMTDANAADSVRRIADDYERMGRSKARLDASGEKQKAAE